MVYGMRSTHGMPSSQDTTGGYAKTGMPCIPSIPYTTGGYAKTCILCIPRIPYTMGGMRKSAYHAYYPYSIPWMQLRNKSHREAVRFAMRTAEISGWYMVCVVRIECEVLRGLGWDVGRSR